MCTEAFRAALDKRNRMQASEVLSSFLVEAVNKKVKEKQKKLILIVFLFNLKIQHIIISAHNQYKNIYCLGV